jgi:hypothetical protein
MKKLCLPLFLIVAALFTQQLCAQTQINQSNISSFPYTITKPGSYILTSNLTVSAANTTAIMVYASDVTIDLNGFSIIGPMSCTASGCSSSSSGYGVNTQYNNLTLKNGTISGFDEAVFAAYGNVENLTVYSCAYGIAANYSTVRHNQVYNISEFAITTSYSSIIENQVSASYFGIYGIYSSNMNNTSASNSQDGLIMWGGYAAGNILTSNGTDLSLQSGAFTTKTNACTSGPC